MELSDLRVIEAVAREGGMSRAATALNTVQSNVTARVRALEQELGCVLFERHSRGVDLTPAGRRLLPYARRIAELAAEAARAASDDGTPVGPLEIGALETTTALRLTPALAHFAAHYPDVDLALRTGTTAELIDAVLERRLEGAFVCGPVSHRELVASEVFREDLAVFAAPGVASLAKALDGGDVRIIVLKAGCSYRQRLETLLARRGIPVPRLLEFGTLEAIGRCVSAGLGITMLPVGMAGNVWPEGVVSVHRPGKRDSEVHTLFVRRREAFVSSAMHAFLGEFGSVEAKPRRVA